MNLYQEGAPSFEKVGDPWFRTIGLCLPPNCECKFINWIGHPKRFLGRILLVNAFEY